MWKLIDETLNKFKICFSRQAAFSWFVIIIIGFMIRSDSLGVSSVIRDLSINPNYYATMMHFFRSDSWNLSELRKQWITIVKNIALLWNEEEMVILIGDGVKQSKEGRKIPGVKKLHQESENSSKAEYIFGHMFGGVGVLAGNISKLFCVPLSLKIHDGVKTIKQWNIDVDTIESHVVEMIKDGFEVAKIMGESLLLLDRYFLSVPALIKLEQLNSTGDALLHVVTKAKASCKAYRKPTAYSGKGRPRKKGDTVKLKDLFESEKSKFKKTSIMLYGKEENVEYLCLNLLWGQKIYKELRFVLVKYNGKNSILVSTKLDLCPEAIIRLYSYRFKIECTFRELKQVIGGFSYQFWSKSMPKLRRYAKKTDKNPLENIESEEAKKRILKTLRAIECYVLCSSIAMGLLQIISINFSKEINESKFRFLRTKSKTTVSEATVSAFLRKNIFMLMIKHRKSSISQIISRKQHEQLFDINTKVS